MAIMAYYLNKLGIFMLSLALLLLSTGCYPPGYLRENRVGADEFVIDSYKIREGKFSILEFQGVSYEDLPNEFLEEYKDVIQDGDILTVSIFHPTRGDITHAIQAIGVGAGFQISEGTIRLPDLEPISIVGLTLNEACQKIEQAYSTYIRDVQIFLSYKDRLARKVELAGLVEIPSIPVDGKIRLFEILSKARIPPQANLFKSYLIRNNKILRVDFVKLLKEGDMKYNIVMRGGDKIYIAHPSASTLMVLGEVAKEKVVEVPDGFMTIRQAIAEAGGIPYTGNKAYIQIIRGNIQDPKIYTLSWEHVIHLPSHSLLLIPGDIVYVAAKPLTEWNRFISQLLPTFINIDLITKKIKNSDALLP